MGEDALIAEGLGAGVGARGAASEEARAGVGVACGGAPAGAGVACGAAGLGAAAPAGGPLCLDVHLPFSYWRQRDLDHGDPAVSPKACPAGAYARALVAEIESLGADLAGQGHAVAGVFFSGGYLGLLDPEDFRDILRAVRRAFTVAGLLRVEGVTFPGSVDMYAASAYLDEGMGALMLEMPTLSAREAAVCGLPNVLQALDKSVYVLQSYGAAEFGLRLPADIPGRSRDTWAYLLGQVNHYRPMHVELSGGGASGGASEDEGRTLFERGLRDSGYRRVAGAAPGRCLFTRASADPLFACLPGPAACGAPPAGVACERLGVGLGAQTCVDGFWTKSTTDLARYLAQAGDYRDLVVEAREV